MFEIVANALQIYSTSTLYTIMLWFGLVGSILSAALIIFLTKIKPWQALLSVMQMYAIALLIAGIIAPMMSVLLVKTQELLFVPVAQIAVGMHLYVWYGVIVIMVLRHILCQMFVSVACRRWNIGLWIIHIFVMVMGYVVLRSLQIL